MAALCVCVCVRQDKKAGQRKNYLAFFIFWLECFNSRECPNLRLQTSWSAGWSFTHFWPDCFFFPSEIGQETAVTWMRTDESLFSLRMFPIKMTSLLLLVHPSLVTQHKHVKSRKKYLIFLRPLFFFCLCHFLWSGSLAPAFSSPCPPPFLSRSRPSGCQTLTCKKQQTKHPICAISSKGAAW